MSAYRFWNVGASGEVFAVMLNADGSIAGSSGPLHHSEIVESELPNFDYRTDDNEWLEGLYEAGRTRERHPFEVD